MASMLKQESTATCILVATLIWALPVSPTLGMHTRPGHIPTVTTAAMKTERVLIGVEGMSCHSSGGSQCLPRPAWQVRPWWVLPSLPFRFLSTPC